MSASVASPTVLLNRVLSLRESCPFLLANDTFFQSATFLTNELVHKSRSSNPNLTIVFLSFETATPPSYLTKGKDIFLSILNQEFEPLLSKVLNNAQNEQPSRKLIIVDSFNYLPLNKLISLLQMIMSPAHTVYGVYHQDILSEFQDSKKPNVSSYLQFLSTCVFNVKSKDSDDSDSMYSNIINYGIKFPIDVRSTQLNNYVIDLLYRRKSGRSLEYKFAINSTTHEYELVVANKQTQQEDEELLKDLTTFNLNTTKKQREQREQVDLPFLEAQKSMGSVGGSIVYEFEKDDDYDEDDPFEDPF